MVGKYTQLPDAYLSVIEALHHSGVFYDRHALVQTSGKILRNHPARKAKSAANRVSLASFPNRP